MHLDDVVRLADLNHIESWRELARWTAAGELAEQGDLLLGAAATRSPAFNFAMRTGLEATPDSASAIARARTFFAARNRGFLLHVRAHVDQDLGSAAEAAGWPRVRPDVPVMVLDASPAPRPGPTVEVIDSLAAAAGFVNVTAEAYAALELPGDVLHKVFADPARILAPHCTLAVVRDGGDAVGAGMLLLSHGIGGIYWIGTRVAARRRGVADAITRHLSRLAFERGAAAVILQASEYGRPVYDRIGFREVTSYARYVITR